MVDLVCTIMFSKTPNQEYKEEQQDETQAMAAIQLFRSEW
jgi:hypothetical protein